MKTIIQKIKIIILGLIVAVGISYAFAWTGPAGAPPTGNVPAPLNVGDIWQIKDGALTVNASTSPVDTGLTVFRNSIFKGSVQINDGTAAKGSVLYSTDSSGDAQWVATSSLGLGGGSSGSSGVSQIIAGTNITISPTGGTGAVTINAASPSGTVGGGCYVSSTSNNHAGGLGSLNWSSWGNASGCACPSGYSSQMTAATFITDPVGSYTVSGYQPTGYECIKN